MYRIFLLLCLSIVSLHSWTQAVALSDRIKLNQVGFYPNAPKLAVITGTMEALPFYITTTNTRDTIFRGVVGAAIQSSNSTTTTRIADFSAVTKEGTFFLLVPGIGHSYSFHIGKRVHHAVGKASLKGFYFQRVSMPLEPQFAGRWQRSAGHADTVVYVHPSAASASRPPGTKLSSPGGWYDAGDYNKYIVNSGITMGSLLSAYEDFPSFFDTLQAFIPESANRIPDILDEVLYNLRWMLTMQDPHDGGVYHKCTNASFDGMVMPGVTTAPRYVVQKGTAATLDFAAVMAQASRVFQKFKSHLPGLADSCRTAAGNAWAWALKHPAVAYNQEVINSQHHPHITTGAYGDRNMKDEWLWAAAELFVTTKAKNYFDTVAAHLPDSIVLQSWSNVGMMAYYTLNRFATRVPAFAQGSIAQVQARILLLAEQLLQPWHGNAFATVMGGSRRDFVWGSSAVAANQGIALINAWLIHKNRVHIDAALSNLDYLMGRNATGYCFLTGSGSRSPMHPHHRQSVADGVREPVPGLLSGGPNPGRQDSCQYEFTETETAFTDHDCSYASNEIAINWNAPMVYLANAIEAIQFACKYSDDPSRKLELKNKK